MPNGQYQAQIARFNQLYQTDLTTGTIHVAIRKFEYLDNFLFEVKRSHANRSDYTRAIGTVLKLCIDSALKAKADGATLSPSFKIIDFLQDFENLMDARAKQMAAEKGNEAPERQPYEGLDIGKLIKAIGKKIESVSVSIDQQWKNNVIDKTITLAELETSVEAAKEFLVNNPSEKASSAAELSSKAQSYLTTVVAAREAMAGVREARGFFWKLFHPVQNYREKKTFERLSEKANTISEIGYPVNDMTESVKQNRPLERYKEETYQTDYLYRINKAKEKEIAPDDKQAEKIKSTKAAVIFENAVKADGFKEKTVNEILQALDGSGYPVGVRKTLLNGSVYDSFINKVQGLCTSYDGVLEGGQETYFAYATNNLFKEVYDTLSAMNYSDVKKQIIAAQKITDVLLKSASPARFEKETYGRFAEGYCLLHQQSTIAEWLVEKEDGYNRDEVKQMLSDAAEEYQSGINEKQQIIVNDAEEPIVQAVSQPIQVVKPQERVNEV